jgi:fatty-acyl-CoA synthase
MAEWSELLTFDEFLKHWAEERSDREAMRFEDRSYTHAELEDRTARAATALLELERRPDCLAGKE